MISHIYGEIAECGEGYVVIDAGGIGYQIIVGKTASKELAGKKEKVKLYTYLNVREDCLVLYGFLSRNELTMFRLLIGVTRIGPQIAMNILSQTKIEELAAAIIQEDEKFLGNISGVGPKNAKRLILELNDIMKKKIGEVSLPAARSVHYDAVSALVSLGFSRYEAQKAVEEVAGKEGTVEGVIRAALLKLKDGR